MVRFLHLRAEPADEQSRRLSELLAGGAAPAGASEIRTIGRGGTYRSLLDATLRLRHELRRFDVLHVWDSTTLSVASWLRAPRVVASLSAGLPQHRPKPGPGAIHWVCSTPHQLKLARARFGGQDRCSLIDPCVPVLQGTRQSGTSRSPVGLTEDDRVLLVPGESTRAAGHETAVWVTSMLHII